MSSNPAYLHTCAECGEPTGNRNPICDTCIPLYEDVAASGKCANCDEDEMEGGQCKYCGWVG